VIPSEALAAVKPRLRVSGTLRRGVGVHVRIVGEEAPGPGAQPAEATLEDAYLWFIGSHRAGSSAGDGARAAAAT